MKTFYDVAIGHLYDLLDPLAEPRPKGRLSLTSEREIIQGQARGAIDLLLKQLEEVELGADDLPKVPGLIKSLRLLAPTAGQTLGGEWSDRMEDRARRLQLKYTNVPVATPAEPPAVGATAPA